MKTALQKLRIIFLSKRQPLNLTEVLAHLPGFKAVFSDTYHRAFCSNCAAVSCLCCLSVSNEGLCSCNCTPSYCVCAQHKRSLLVGSVWITSGIFIKAYDIWSSGSGALSVPPIWVMGSHTIPQWHTGMVRWRICCQHQTYKLIQFNMQLETNDSTYS